MSKKYVYLFSEGNANMRELLGGKGANLAEMSNIGLPVPQGFTITTEACTQYYEDGRQINDSIMAEIMKNVEIMEQINGKKFGDLKNPLLVSVRSGARASMPGMMDTILNLGLNDDVVAAMIAGNPDPKFERFLDDFKNRGKLQPNALTTGNDGWKDLRFVLAGEDRIGVGGWLFQKF